MAGNIKKILIRGANWIGDAVLTTPAIRAVRIAYPDAYIALLTRPWVADIFKGSPDINEVILYEDRFTGLGGRLKLARLLRVRGFHSAVLLQNAFDAALVTWLAGIPERIGYRRDWRGPLLTTSIEVKSETLRQHQVFYYLDLLKKSLNIEPDITEPCLYLEDSEIRNARSVLYQSFAISPRTPLIGINPGSTYGPAKRWPTERFAGLIQKIIHELDGKVVLFGSKSEKEIAGEIVSRILPPESSFLNMAGRTNLRELAAFISECDVFITNDSGPMHMAAALLVPVVAIFGSTDYTTTGPFGHGHTVITKNLSCSPCLERECPVNPTQSREAHLRCMTDITVDNVFTALKQTLQTRKAVFLDRDGTLNEDTGYLNSFSNLKIFKGTGENLQRLKQADFKLIGITNQSGIARGIVSKEFVTACNSYLQKTFEMDDFYYCPHHPDDSCQCRKPKPGLIRKARLQHRINLRVSYVIGDKTLDVLVAKAVGAKGILVQTGHDSGTDDADFIAKDLTEAVDWILLQEKK
jgi:heptosyltransferase-2